ncbi:carbohydrate ABC transporter permease [Cohnella lupini]|uniref:Putative aldouronate transport system permease protein n=1 Tax=Cohnella lupini TaxID=1294267 RepID=A0A3D9INA3_9BACL|nr:carbohydrate ABC transporter permease [Cohnella lupini]RED63253.1 putative aldouronate transport system permease protein [Cohnella lupini]
MENTETQIRADSSAEPMAKRRGKRIGIADVIIHSILMLMTLFMIFPFYNVVLMSFSNTVAISKQAVYLIPTVLDLSAYDYIFHDSRFWNAFYVTLFVTSVGTLVNMFATVTGAYVLSKKGYPGRNIIMSGILFTIFFSGGLIPLYLAMKDIHLINKLLVMVLPVAINTFYLIICIAFFRTLPAALEESAKIDGANDIQILYKVILPIAKPMVATIALFYAVDRWNEWWYGVLFMTDTKFLPLQALLREILTNFSMLQTNINASAVLTKGMHPEMLKMAILVVSTLPIACLYPFLQKYFTKGVMIGSIKG